MTQVVIGDIIPYTQAIAILGQTVFGTNWTANAASDIIVFQTPNGSSANDVTQILPYPAGYSVSFIGAQQQVQVTLSTAANARDIITIIRNTPADRMNLYSNTNFTPDMLNNDFGILTLVDQQAQLVNQLVGPRYNYSANISDVVDTILPILGPNQFWIKDSTNLGFIPYTIPTSTIPGGIFRVATQLITSSRTYTPTPGTVFASVELCGGGGGSGGATGAAGATGIGGGGAGAGYCKKLYGIAQIGSSAAVVIGSGGTAGASGSNAGATGGTSTFTPSGTGLTLTATGGSGGNGGANSATFGSTSGGSSAGTGTNGDINISGSKGTPGVIVNGIGGEVIGGTGGNSYLSTPTVNATFTGSIPGNLYGGGASGGISGGGVDVPGAAGAPGVCIITEYIGILVS